MRFQLAALLLIAPLAVAQEVILGTVDFFAYEGLDLKTLQDALPYRAGSTVDPELLERDLAQFGATIGHAGVSVSLSCCLPDGRYELFVGIRPTGDRTAQFRPEPSGSNRLPAELLELYADFYTAFAAAASAGRAGEEWLSTYALMEDPATRQVQLNARQYAQSHVEDLLGVLRTGSDARHREAAVWALSVTDASEQRWAALVEAATDPDPPVRQNAMRALAVQLRFVPETASQAVSPESFFPLLHSVLFNDRHRAAALLNAVTANSRNAALLDGLRRNALVPLLEMASWNNRPHADHAFLILGRIAGLEEARIQDLFERNDLQPILRVLRP